MLSFDDRSRGSFNPGPGIGQPVSPFMRGNPTAPLPGSPVGGPQQVGSTGNLVPLAPAQWSPVTTGALSDPSNITRALTGALSNGSQTTAFRTPVVIKGGMKKEQPAPPLSPEVHKKRRVFVSMVSLLLLFIITISAVFVVTPLGKDLGLGFDPLSIASNSFGAQNNLGSFAAQATSAAYHQQVPPAGIITDGSSSLAWPYGQCTYWANLRYHQLTNHWVSWGGNADQWVAGARAAGHGWMVDTRPHLPSIIVLMPGVQYASGVGHVAVVESINADGSAHTSNMNWGGPGRYAWVDFYPGYGVYFVYHV